MKQEEFHIPVLLKEVVQYLAPQKGGVYVDGTLGGGGHAKEIIKKIGPAGRLIGIDQDPGAISFAKNYLKDFVDQIRLVKDNFINLNDILKKLKIEKVEGILFDLGVSSFQLETSQRGFSFSEKKTNLSVPLDMRMNPAQPVRACEIINFYPEKRLKKLFFELGEEPYARQIAREIVRRRKIKKLATCGDLLEAIRVALPAKLRFSRPRGQWASKVFRALRMEVNQELVALEKVLPQALASLASEGRLVVISFHSLEDRIVKQHFLAWEKEGLVEILTPKPVMASQEEIRRNSRADSAKLRAVIKLS